MSPRAVPPAQQTPMFEPPEGMLPIERLSDTGLLWLINSSVFWPRGYSLGLVCKRDPDDRSAEATDVVGFQILGDGTVAWLPSSEAKATERLQAVTEFFASLRADRGDGPDEDKAVDFQGRVIA